MKVRVATIFLHNGRLVASKRCGVVVRVRLSPKQRKSLLWQARIKVEQYRLTTRRIAVRRKDVQEVWDIRCMNVASGLRIRARLNKSGKLRNYGKRRTKVICGTISDRCLVESDKVRASNKNKDRNHDRWFMKCMSITRNMKTRCNVGKYECASARELRQLLDEQAFRCDYTGEELREDSDNARVDHKVPVSRGGTSRKGKLALGDGASECGERADDARRVRGNVPQSCGLCGRQRLLFCVRPGRGRRGMIRVLEPLPDACKVCDPPEKYES